MEPVILASSSPRRQEILKLLKIPYQVIMPDIDETVPQGASPESVPELFARQKVEAVVKSLPSDRKIRWVLGADTVVIFGGKIFGKPQSQEQAEEFLSLFSGHTHSVKTSVALYNGTTQHISIESSRTEVTFKTLSPEEISWYIETGEWHGAAGGYRIQSLASCFIQNINGSMTGVMGLPIFELYDILKKQGYSVLE